MRIAALSFACSRQKMCQPDDSNSVYSFSFEIWPKKRKTVDVESKQRTSDALPFSASIDFVNSTLWSAAQAAVFIKEWFTNTHRNASFWMQNSWQIHWFQPCHPLLIPFSFLVIHFFSPCFSLDRINSFRALGTHLRERERAREGGWEGEMQDADDVAAALMILRRENAERHTKLARVRLILGETLLPLRCFWRKL